MSTTLRETFRRQADAAEPPELDLDAVVARGDSRLRRRRRAATGGAAAVVGGIALAVALALTPAQAPSPGPAHPRLLDPPGAHAPSARPLVWSDVDESGGARIHYGDRIIVTGRSPGHLDVTDDGVVYTTEDGVWFSDGGPWRRIGADYCGSFANFGTDSVQSSTTGSLVAWLDCSQRVPEVVVVDTAASSTQLQRPLPACGPPESVTSSRGCGVRAVVGEHVYVERSVERLTGRGDTISHDMLVVDVADDRVDPITAAQLDDDVRSQPRGLVLGTSWRSGNAVAGGWVRYGDSSMPVTFRAVGTRLVPIAMLPPRGLDAPTSAFDTGTGRRLDLRLPEGYRGDPESSFFLSQWLDDDTLVLVDGGVPWRCRVPDGRCAVAAPAPGDTARTFPGLPLPG